MTTNGFDFHCHVDLFPNPEALIAQCDRDQIMTLAVTTTPKAWEQNRLWTEHSRCVLPAVGLHPELVGQRYAEIALLEDIMAETPFVGEIGLDGSAKYRNTLSTQKDVFSRALRSAQRLGARILSIHSRGAAREVLALLSEHTTSDRVLPILHWFSGSVELAAEAVQVGCYFSINHRMLDSRTGIAVTRRVPADRLLTETDAPFIKINQRTSEPQDVSATIARLAELRNVSIDEMKHTVASNAERVLSFARVSIPTAGR